MSNSAPLQVAVVGGGVLGVSTAQHLARAGASVVLITEGEITNNASGRSLSWLNSAGVRSEAYHRLRMAGIDRYRTLFSRQPEAGWLRFDGGLAWQSDDKADAMQQRHQHELAHGYDSHLVGSADVAQLVPGVDPAAIPAAGAIWNPGEGWVDLPSLAQYLLQDLEEAGGRIITRAGRAQIEVADGRVSGVRTAAGEFVAADAAVLATGPAVPAMAADLGITVPDATSISLLVTTKPVDLPLRSVLNTPRASLRPTPGGSLAVDSGWPNDSITQDADGSYQVPSEIIDQLLAEAASVLAGHPKLEVEWYGMGPKPIPGDGDPVLGAVDDVDGLHLAFTHSGATLGLIAGELLAYEIVSGRPHPMLADFNIRRFS